MNLIVLCLFLLLSIGAKAQIYVSNNGSNTVGVYSSSGPTINGNLIPGLPFESAVDISGIVVVGSNLYLVNTQASTVEKYTTSGSLVSSNLLSGTTLFYPTDGITSDGTYLYATDRYDGYVGKFLLDGTVVNETFLSNLDSPAGISVFGGYLYVTNRNAGTVQKFNASSGGLDTLFHTITGLNDPTDIAVTSSNVFVAEFGSGRVDKFALNGTTVSSPLTTGSGHPYGLAVSGSTLLVGDAIDGVIRSFDSSNGALINSSLINGLNYPKYFSVVPTIVSIVKGDGADIPVLPTPLLAFMAVVFMSVAFFHLSKNVEAS
jgi:hypothetical protein